MTTELDVTAGDYGFVWTFTLENNDGTALDLTGADSVSFKMQLQNTTGVLTGSMVVDATPTTGIVTYTVGAHDFPEAGRYNCEIEVVFPGSTITFGDITVVATGRVPLS